MMAYRRLVAYSQADNRCCKIGLLKKRGIMGKSQETQQLAVGMSRKCGFGSYRPMEKARKRNNLL
jgi:hypothetical protein